jgi:hypothetical protein
MARSCVRPRGAVCGLLREHTLHGPAGSELFGLLRSPAIANQASQRE